MIDLNGPSLHFGAWRTTIVRCLVLKNDVEEEGGGRRRRREEEGGGRRRKEEEDSRKRLRNWHVSALTSFGHAAAASIRMRAREVEAPKTAVHPGSLRYRLPILFVLPSPLTSISAVCLRTHSRNISFPLLPRPLSRCNGPFRARYWPYGDTRGLTKGHSTRYPPWVGSADKLERM